MAMNWDRFAKAKSESGGGFKAGRRFVIKDGESAIIRFFPSDQEPFIFKEHYVNSARRYLVCAEDAAREGKHEGCVPCFLARTGNKAYKQAARKFSFSVIDSRKYHTIEKDGKKTYENCTDDSACKFCRKGIESKTSGVRYWSLNQSVADQIRTFEKDILGKTCRCGGRLKVTGYFCPECDDELEPDDPNEVTRCFNCEKTRGKKRPFMVHAEEALKCSKCSSPKRVSLTDAWIIVTRSGTQTNTSYNFAVSEIVELEAVYADMKPVEFSGHPDFVAVSAAEQAAICNTRNPFGNSSKPPRADDDDEGDGSKPPAADDDDDDDADNLNFKDRIRRR